MFDRCEDDVKSACWSKIKRLPLLWECISHFTSQRGHCSLHITDLCGALKMLSLRYDSRTRFFLSVIPFLLILITLAFDFHESLSQRLDTCYILREHEKPPSTLIPLGDAILHNYSVYIMWLSMFLLALLPSDRPRGVYNLTFASIWFHVTYILLAALKAPLQDFNCAGRHAHYPNGISGHYCYFIFVALTTPLYAQSRLRTNPNVPKAVLVASATLMGLFTIGATATLYRTYFHGYHSPRQIALGAALGILSHVGLEVLLFRDGKEVPVRISMMTLAAASLTALTLYARVWPHQSAGAAIGQGQLIFHVTLWIILSIAAGIRGKTEIKVAMD